jgi:hypothetical protein
VLRMPGDHGLLIGRHDGQLHPARRSLVQLLAVGIGGIGGIGGIIELRTVRESKCGNNVRVNVGMRGLAAISEPNFQESACSLKDVPM